VDDLGGAVAAIEHGFFAREIEESAYAAQREVEDGRRTVVGVNAFREEDAPAPPLLSVDPDVERDQVERLTAFRTRRDPVRSAATLDALRRDAAEDRNVMPAILEAVSSNATLGEVVSTLKSVFGEHGSGG
jgi:methylmalonyl-CoA mutase N-terminal domain/subunit